MDEPYYGADLALIHHRGFGFHADMCAPGILRLLAPVRARGGSCSSSGAGPASSRATSSRPAIA